MENNIQKGMVINHKGMQHTVVNVHQWNVVNSIADVKNYPPTKFTEVAVYNAELGLSKIYI